MHLCFWVTGWVQDLLGCRSNADGPEMVLESLVYVLGLIATEKNWEGLGDKVVLRIQKWRWILPYLSFWGDVWFINNLAAFMLWHNLLY